MYQYDIGMIGCGVMGQNLALNMERNGYSIVMFDSDQKKVQKYLSAKAAGKNIVGVSTPVELIANLKKPKRIMLMVPAGEAVDKCIESLLPYLGKGDLLIDGGNSNYRDTNRRTREMESRGILYIGTGVSGGEEGALRGPSIMPGGSPQAWNEVKPLFQSICAKTPDGSPCCDWVGEGGAGHFVKMIHNGIEYGDMQLICEMYHIMKEALELSNEDMHKIFAEWNRGELQSYLIEITRDILAYRSEDGEATLDIILDKAGQKGTGKWTVIEALELGQPVTLIAEAVFARCLSALKEERVAASSLLAGTSAKFSGDKKQFIEDLRQTLYAAKIVSYAQGYQLMQAAAKEYGWNLNYGGIALMWRGGCIIRSVFLEKIKEAFEQQPDLGNLMLAPFFRLALEQAQDSWRKVISSAVQLGIPIPAISAALAYYDGYRHAWLPANLLQAQRDYFGAHTYKRIDRPAEQSFHTSWTE